jgi:hypothetical protein
MTTMRRIFVFAAVLCLAAPLAAQQVTKRFDYKPVDSIQPIAIAIDKVKINQIVFKTSKEIGGPVRRSTAECVVRVDNDGTTPVAVGVAVAILDGDGNIVAAGSGGTRVGWLSAGERDTSAIRFPFVYRNLDKAKTFMITMEVEPKPPKDEKKPAPEPTP